MQSLNAVGGASPRAVLMRAGDPLRPVRPSPGPALEGRGRVPAPHPACGWVPAYEVGGGDARQGKPLDVGEHT